LQFLHFLHTAKTKVSVVDFSISWIKECWSAVRSPS